MSMFGENPYEVQQQQRVNRDTQALNFARMTPMERANYQIYKGAGGLASGVAGMMGMKTGAEQQAEAMQGAMAGIDPRDPDYYLKVAAAAQKLGNFDLAQKAVAEHNKILNAKELNAYRMKPKSARGTPANEKEAVLMARARQAAIIEGSNANLVGDDLDEHITKRINEAQALYRENIGVPQSPTPSAVQPTPVATQDIPQSLRGSVPISQGASLNLTEPLSKKDKDLIIKDLLSRGDEEGAAKVQAMSTALPYQSKLDMIGKGAQLRADAEATIPGKTAVPYKHKVTGELMYGSNQIAAGHIPVAVDPATQAAASTATATGKAGAELNIEQFKSAQSAADNTVKINLLITHLEKSEAITGLGSTLFKNIERVKTLFGSKAAEGKVSSTELLDIMMGSDVFPMIKELGIGARGMDTPVEREFMRQVLTGEIALNKETLLEMSRMRKRISDRTVERWDSRVDKGELDSFFRDTGRTKGKLGQPVIPPTDEAYELRKKKLLGS